MKIFIIALLLAIGYAQTGEVVDPVSGAVPDNAAADTVTVIDEPSVDQTEVVEPVNPMGTQGGVEPDTIDAGAGMGGAVTDGVTPGAMGTGAGGATGATRSMFNPYNMYGGLGMYAMMDGMEDYVDNLSDFYSDPFDSFGDLYKYGGWMMQGLQNRGGYGQQAASRGYGQQAASMYNPYSFYNSMMPYMYYSSLQRKHQQQAAAQKYSAQKQNGQVILQRPRTQSRLMQPQPYKTVYVPVQVPVKY